MLSNYDLFYQRFSEIMIQLIQALQSFDLSDQPVTPQTLIHAMNSWQGPEHNQKNKFCRYLYRFIPCVLRLFFARRPEFGA